MAKVNTCIEAVKRACSKARHAGKLSVPAKFGVRRDTGEGQNWAKPGDQ